MMMSDGVDNFNIINDLFKFIEINFFKIKRNN